MTKRTEQVSLRQSGQMPLANAYGYWVLSPQTRPLICLSQTENTYNLQNWDFSWQLLCDYFDWSLFFKIQAWNIMNRELLFLNMGFFCNNFNTFHQIRNCPPQLYIHNTSKETKWTFLKRNDRCRPIFRSILFFYCFE